MGLLQHREGGPIVAEHVERRAKHVQRVEKVRTENGGLFKWFPSFLIALQAEIAQSQVVPSFERTGIHLCGAAQRLERLGISAMLAVQLPEQDQLLRIVRVEQRSARIRS